MLAGPQGGGRNPNNGGFGFFLFQGNSKEQLLQITQQLFLLPWDKTPLFRELTATEMNTNRHKSTPTT
jgi:hypothetical protein